MKVLLVNTYSIGGAAAACIRLHQGLLKYGIDSKLLLLNFSGNRAIENFQVYTQTPAKRNLLTRAIKKILRITRIDKSIYDNKIKEQIRGLIPNTIEWFSFPDSGIDISQHPFFEEADIVNVHWIADFVDFSYLTNQTKPIIWSLHDMNAFTGGCHYSGECDKFLSGCSVCPQLSDCDNNKFSARNFRIKKRTYKRINNFYIVALSKWLMDLSKGSPLLRKFPHYHIPNGIDADVFQMREKDKARQFLGLPSEQKIFLFIATDLTTKRKGYSLLKSAFERLGAEDVILCTVGKPGIHAIDKFNVFELGEISTEEEMSVVYSAADLLVMPSLEDNLPNTVIEALLCGLPVAGFSIGGLPDMITNDVNGYLADIATEEQLLNILNKYLKREHVFDREEIRNKAIERFGLSVQVRRYRELYESILNQ